jgi:hypothetical protein
MDLDERNWKDPKIGHLLRHAIISHHKKNKTPTRKFGSGVILVDYILEHTILILIDDAICFNGNLKYSTSEVQLAISSGWGSIQYRIL